MELTKFESDYSLCEFLEAFLTKPKFQEEKNFLVILKLESWRNNFSKDRAVLRLLTLNCVNRHNICSEIFIELVTEEFMI